MVAEKNDLAERLRGVLSWVDTGLEGLAEIRMRDFDDSVSRKQVALAITGEGGCSVGGIQVRKLHRSPGGLFSV